MYTQTTTIKRKLRSLAWLVFNSLENNGNTKFEENGDFSLAKMMPNGLEIRKYKPYMDNFMYANYIAVSNKVLNK